MTDSYVALDLETTGIGAKKEKITEIGMVKVLDGQIVSTYHSLVNPRRPIPEEIVRLTGIDDFHGAGRAGHGRDPGGDP